MRRALKGSVLAVAVLSLAACGGQEREPAGGASEVANVPQEATARVQPGADVDGARILAARSTPEDWLTYGGTYDEQRHSLLTKVNKDNVDQLGVA